MSRNYQIKVHNNNQINEQSISNYLIKNQTYPFKNNKGKFFIFNSQGYNDEIIKILQDIYHNLCIIYLNQFCLVFYFDNFDISIKDLFETIREDLLIDIILHDGMWFNNTSDGSKIYKYITYLINNEILLNKQKLNTNLTDVIYMAFQNKEIDLINFIRSEILYILNQKPNNIEILKAFFVNNLNVSATAKKIYMHRNSLINKLNQLSYILNINVQEFLQASAILMLMINEL